jgi:hypothetical protein
MNPVHALLRYIVKINFNIVISQLILILLCWVHVNVQVFADAYIYNV